MGGGGERERQGGGERTGRFAASHAKRIRNCGKDKEERREEGRGGLEGVSSSTTKSYKSPEKKKLRHSRKSRCLSKIEL